MLDKQASPLQMCRAGVTSLLCRDPSLAPGCTVHEGRGDRTACMVTLRNTDVVSVRVAGSSSACRAAQDIGPEPRTALRQVAMQRSTPLGTPATIGTGST